MTNPSCKIALGLLLLLSLTTPARNGMCKERQQQIIAMWWNVENLFDAKNDPNIDDQEFTPEGKRRWTEKKLLLKRLRIARVFNAIKADREYGKYPDIVAFAETENRQVFAGTLAAIDRAGYAIDYHESPDPRGIDIGLAWNPATVKFTGSKPYRVVLDSGRDTRFVIAAGFVASGHPFNVVLNHWPSRSFDARWSEPNRIAAARVARRIVDSLRTRDPQAEIIVMGDFNDHPADRSVRETLGSSLNRNEVQRSASRRLYNCWNDASFPGSYFYRNHWERIDHILVSPALIDSNGLRIGNRAFRVFSIPEMFDRSGKGLYSTYKKGKFTGGYSDHLPLLLKINVQQ
jgi:exonuclease III